MGGIRRTVVATVLAFASVVGGGALVDPVGAAPADGTSDCTYRIVRLPHPKTRHHYVFGRVLGSDGADRYAGYLFRIADGGPTNVRYTAVVWTNGIATDLDTIDGDATRAADVNQAGDAVGWRTVWNSPWDSHPVLWRGGTPITLPEPAGAVRAFAVAINDHGLIVGHAVMASGAIHGLIWSASDPGQVRDLGPEIGPLMDVDNTGRVVGWSATAPTTALVGTPDRLTALPSPMPGAATATALAGRFVTGTGTVTDDGGGTRPGPVLWSDGVPSPLPGTLAPAGVNSNGLVIANGVDGGPDKSGSATDASYLSHGQWHRLPLAPNDLYQAAHAIVVNDNGVIAGNGGLADGEFPALWICT